MTKKTKTTIWAVSPDVSILYTDGERDATLITRNREQVLSEEILINILNAIKEVLTEFPTDP